MARSGAKDRKYLEEWRGKWRVTVAVPKALQGRLGTRLKQPLNTDSLTIANQLKWPIVAEMQATIAQARGSGTDVRAIAEEFRRQRQKAQTDEEAEAVVDGISSTIDVLLGKPAGVEVDPLTGE